MRLKIGLTQSIILGLNQLAKVRSYFSHLGKQIAPCLKANELKGWKEKE